MPFDSKDITINRIDFSGIKRTNSKFLTKIVSKLIGTKDYTEFLLLLSEVDDNLRRLGTFSDVQSFLSKHKDGYMIEYRLKEPGVIGAGLNTLVGNYDSSLSSFLKINNFAGECEQFSFTASINTQKHLGFNATLQKPLIFGKFLSSASLNAFSHVLEYPWTNLMKDEKGLVLMLNSFFSKHLSYAFGVEGSFREAKPSFFDTLRPLPDVIKTHFGSSYKTAFKHNLTYDTRDNAFLPNYGTLLKVEQEFSIPTNHISQLLKTDNFDSMTGLLPFVKTQGTLHYNIPSIFNSVLQFTLNGGFIVLSSNVGPSSDSLNKEDVSGDQNDSSLSNGNKDPKSPNMSYHPFDQRHGLNMMDKFYLGGPLSFRGFTFGGLGPHEDGHALGVDSFWQLGLHLYAPIPSFSSPVSKELPVPHKRPQMGLAQFLRLHAYVTAGSVGNFIGGKAQDSMSPINLSEMKGKVWSILYDHLRISAGVGLVLNFGNMARCEFNYCLFTKAHATDKLYPGLQMGIGLDFS